MPKSEPITSSQAAARSTALLLGLLTLSTAAVVLWLVLHSIRSERLASREQWREAAQLRLQNAVTRMRESWQQREATVNQLSELPPAEAFTIIVRDHLADSSVCGSGADRYPSLDDATRTADAEDMQKLATLRELIAKGDHDGALALSSDYYKAHRDGTTADGRNIAAAADLMLMSALAKKGRTISDSLSARLIEHLKAYSPSPMPSAQRRFLMEQVAALLHRHPTDLFPTYNAEVMAQRYLSNADTVEPSSSLVIARMRDAVLLIDPTQLARTGEDDAVRLMLLSDSSTSTDELTSEVWPALPEWRAVLSLKEHMAVSQAGSTFGLALGGGIATLVLAMLTALTWRNVQQQLRRAQLQEELTATVSHELRTPLASMRLLVESLLEEDTPDAAKTHEYLELIARENTRLSRMIENVLTLARLERGKSAPSQRISVREIIDRIAQASNDAGHGARLRISPELPEASAEIDAASLDVALLNLIDNACKYSPADQLVELSVSLESDQLCFAIRDHGPGLTKDECQRMWLPFERLHDTRHPGCGLGLAIVQRIAKQARGSVEAQSSPGQGSTFTLKIPTA